MSTTSTHLTHAGLRTQPPTVPGAGADPGAPRGARRVRHQAGEALAVMAFSAATSIGFAAAVLLLTHLTH